MTCARLRVLMSRGLAGFLIFIWNHHSLAQEGVVYTDHQTYYLGAHMGSLLPFKIVGMQDTYPAWGMWLSHPSEITQVEYGLLLVNAKGVHFYNGSISLRIDYELAKTLEAYFTLGLDANYFKLKDTSTRTFDFKFSGGSHGGFGALQRIARDLCLRADFKFGFGPGKTLYVGLGILWEIGAGSTASTP